MGYEWTGTHDPGYVTDPRTNNRLFGNVTITPDWFTLSNDASMVLQKSFPGFSGPTTFTSIPPL